MKLKMDKAIHVAVKEKFGSSESSEDDNIDLSDCTIKMTHFEQALSLVTPSVSKQVIIVMIFSHWLSVTLRS